MMKHVRVKTFWHILMILLCLLLLTTMGAAAAEETAKDGDGTPVTTVTFSKDNVRAGETVDVKVTLQNNTPFDLDDVTINAAIPESLTALDGTSRHFDHIAASQTVTAVVSARAGTSGAVATGIDGGGFLTAALLLIVLAGAVFLSWRVKKFFCIILCLAMAAGSLPLANLAQVHAEEAVDPTVQSDTTANTSMDVSYDVTGSLNVEGRSQTVTATVHVGKATEISAGSGTITTSDKAAAGAKRLTLVFNVKNDSFVEGFEKTGSRHIALSQGFADMTVAGIERKDDATMSVTLTGNSSASAAGLVVFDKDTLTETHSPVTVVVQTEDPEPKFSIETCSAENGVLTLPFTLELAEFSQDVRASDFSFLDADGKPVTGFTPVSIIAPSTEGQRDGILRAKIDGKTSNTDLFSAIDGGTMVIGSHATNCGELKVPFVLPAEPAVTVTTSATDSTSTVENNSDGTATLTGYYTATVSVSDGASVNIGQVAQSVEDIQKIDGVSDITDIQVTGPNQFTFVMKEKSDVALIGSEQDYLARINEMPCGRCVTIQGLTDRYGVDLTYKYYVMSPHDDTTIPIGSVGDSLETQGIGLDFLYNTGTSILGDIGGSIVMSAGDQFLKYMKAQLGIVDGDEQYRQEVLSNLSELHKENQELKNQIAKSMAAITEHMDTDKREKKIDEYRTNFNSLNSVIGNVNDVTNVNNDPLKPSEGGSLLVEMAKLDPEKNSADAEEYEKYANRVSKVVNDRGGINDFINNTITLGNKILGEDGADPIFKTYDDLICKKYNWDVESFSSRKQFRAAAVSQYSDAYMICMAYLRNLKTADSYSHDCKLITQQMKDINAYVKSVDAQVKPDPDGLIFNFVTNKHYVNCGLSDFTMEEFTNQMNPFMLIYHPSEIRRFGSLGCNLSDYGIYNEPIEPLHIMEGRAKNNGFKNLYAELQALNYFNFINKKMYVGGFQFLETQYSSKAYIEKSLGNCYNLETGDYEQNTELCSYGVSFRYYFTKKSCGSLGEKMFFTPLVRRTMISY